MRPGRVGYLKTRFSVKSLLAVFLIAAWMVPSLGCTRSVIKPRDLTATAEIKRLTPEFLTQPTLNSSSTGSGQAAVVFATPSQAGRTGPDKPIISATPTQISTPRPPMLYYTQAGDTLSALAVRFAVDAEEILAPDGMPDTPVLPPNHLLIIPDILSETGPGDSVMPDSEIIFSPSAVDFDIKAFVNDAGGYLSTYREWMSTGWNSGAEVVQRVAIENSINPRLLLSLLEFQSHWVYGQPGTLVQGDYPIGWANFSDRGLYQQLSWAVQQLSIGYYGWRAGLLTEMDFPKDANGGIMRLSPRLNAGTAALQYLFARLYNQREWGGALYAAESFPVLHEKMFGNPWLRAQSVEPLYPPNLLQPELQLPFGYGRTWSLTGGPHSAWGPDGALAALDFAPSSEASGCIESSDWITASAPGKVIRSGNGIVVLDLDGDGFEQTGWALLYLHVATKNRVTAGSWVDVDEHLGHPSCEGGAATGTHVHFARKYNGEWILADGPIPFVVGGWRARAGEKIYEGTLEKNGKVVTACTCSSADTLVTREK